MLVTSLLCQITALIHPISTILLNEKIRWEVGQTLYRVCGCELKLGRGGQIYPTGVIDEGELGLRRCAVRTQSAPNTLSVARYSVNSLHGQQMSALTTIEEQAGEAQYLYHIHPFIHRQLNGPELIANRAPCMAMISACSVFSNEPSSVSDQVFTPRNSSSETDHMIQSTITNTTQENVKDNRTSSVNKQWTRGQGSRHDMVALGTKQTAHVSPMSPMPSTDPLCSNVTTHMKDVKSVNRDYSKTQDVSTDSTEPASSVSYGRPLSSKTLLTDEAELLPSAYLKQSTLNSAAVEETSDKQTKLTITFISPTKQLEQLSGREHLFEGNSQKNTPLFNVVLLCSLSHAVHSNQSLSAPGTSPLEICESLGTLYKPVISSQKPTSRMLSSGPMMIACSFSDLSMDLSFRDTV